MGTGSTASHQFSGYWKVQLEEDVKENTEAICKFSTYKFEVMPFGMINSASKFHRLMKDFFKDDKFVRAYLDDFVIYYSSLKSHVEHVKLVVDVIKSHRIMVTLKN